jgi:hypothetical protein
LIFIFFAWVLWIWLLIVVGSTSSAGATPPLGEGRLTVFIICVPLIGVLVIL